MATGHEKQEVLTELLELIRSRSAQDPNDLKESLSDHHPADIAEIVSELSDDRRDAVLSVLDTEARADVLSHVADIDEQAAEEIVEGASVEDLAEVVEEMDPDDAADLLEVADDDKAEAVLNQMETEQAEEVRELRQYGPDTAGGIMTTEFLVARPHETREEILDHLRIEVDDVESMHSVFVCEDERLQGEIFAKELVAAEARETASSIMDRAVVQVVTHTDQEVCARLMQKYDLAALPVVDEQNRLQGIITYDDILDVIEEEAEEDMYRLVGVGDNKPLEHGTVERALKRLPWLSTTLIGMGLIGPLILHRWFEATLDEIVVLAFFIPAIMGLSGNTATQSATITVRGLATGEIGFRDIFWMIRREMAVAMIIAVVCSAAMMIFAYGVVALGFHADTASSSLPRITVTVGISMFAGIIVAVLLGTGIPMVCHRAGVDPAVASGPFITTLIDISTQVIYLGLATWLLLG